MLNTGPREIIIMKALTFSLALAIVLVLAVPTALAQKTDEGQVYSITISPKDPVVFDSVSISIGAKNPSNKAIQYRLELLVTKDGEIKQSVPFTFTLQPQEGTFVSPTFKPDDIGEYEVVAKLSDIFGDLKDIQIRKFRVVSEIGPFDISIDVPSKLVLPGSRTPLILTLANMGEKATDVQVRVTMECQNERDIVQEFFIFLFPGAVQDKQIASDTCRESGAHDITASVIIFNKTWITAVNQIFLNESTIDFDFELPDLIAVKAGESTIFDLKITNNGNSVVDNIRLLIVKIPKEWQQITPASIVQMNPGQSVLFLVNITPPANTPATELELGISAASDQFLKRKETKFRIVSFGGALPQEAGGQRAGGAISVPSIDLLSGNNIFILGGVVAGVGGLIAALRFRRGRAHYHKVQKETAAAPSSDRLRKVAQALSKRKR